MARGGGASILTVLLIVFVVLKLTDNIDWSWWWVLSPLWIPIALVIAGIGLAIAVAVVATLCFGLLALVGVRISLRELWRKGWRDGQ